MSIANEALAVRNKEGKVIGSIACGIFSKTISHKHVLLKPPALCIDAEPFNKLIRPSCHTITIRVMDGLYRGEYTTPMISFCSYHGEIDRGYGIQYFMILERFSKK